MPDPTYIYDIDDDEEVGCYYCMKEGIYNSYVKGEAFLCSSDCPPYDGTANYLCLRCCQGIGGEVIVVDVEKKERRALPKYGV